VEVRKQGGGEQRRVHRRRAAVGMGEVRRSPERCLRNNTIDRIDIDENNAKREDARAIE
jgi:hypothetical protein